MLSLWNKSLLTLSLSVILAACGSDDSSESKASISNAKGQWQTRLACQGNEGEFCHLRTYQVMTESFVNGDGNIGYGVGYGTSHHMGDIQGVIDSLDYIADLGVNAVWLTPVFQSEGHDQIDATGYFSKDYFTIDANFGDLDKAKELVKKAHEKGLYVFFDGVFGHHGGNVVTSPNGLKASDGKGQGPGRESVFPADLEYYQEVVNYWTSELCLDGWRLDQAYQVPVGHWVDLRETLVSTSKVNETRADCKVNDTQWGTLAYMVGEIWQAKDDLIKAAYGSDNNPALPSAFDFPRRYALTQVLAVNEDGVGGLPANTFLKEWNNHDNAYPSHAQPNLMLGNHDLVRFGDLIERGGLGDPSTEDYWLRHKAAFTYMAAYSGPITFYYGEEIGDEVSEFAEQVSTNCADLGLCDDHVARSSGKVEGVTDFVANAAQSDLKKYLSDLMKVRKDVPALYKGQFQNLYASGYLYVDLKEYDSQQVVYLLNADTAPKDVSLAANLLKNDATQLRDLMDGSVIQISANNFEIQVPKLSGRLLLVE